MTTHSDTIEQTVEHVEHLALTEHLDAVIDYLHTLHPSDSAEILIELEADTQAAVVNHFDASTLADVVERMDEDDMVEISQHLDVGRLADLLDEVEADVAADLLGELDAEEVHQILLQMEEAEAVSPLLAYEPDTAGGIMNVAPPALRRQMTIAQAFDFLRTHYADEYELHYLYVLDRFGRLIGVINLRALILAQPDQTVEATMSRRVFSVQPEIDQEEVARMLAHYDLLALPVVDSHHKLIGVVSIDDVVDVLKDEATEDIYRLAQVGDDSELFSPILKSLKNRLPWLIINLGTAILASSVVAFFEGTIARLALLAAFLPIVAGEGGNAGNQTMTIMVRSLALSEINTSHAWQAIWHELKIGLVNGILLGFSIGFIAWFWSGNPILGGIIGVAMLANLLVAAIAGVSVPITLYRIGVDPALASSVFVTTITDVMGFAVFLGLASYFLSWLL